MIHPRSRERKTIEFSRLYAFYFSMAREYQWESGEIIKVKATLRTENPPFSALQIFAD